MNAQFNPVERNADYVRQFRRLYQQEFGVVLSETDAQHRATALLNLYRAVYANARTK